MIEIPPEMLDILAGLPEGEGKQALTYYIQAMEAFRMSRATVDLEQAILVAHPTLEGYCAVDIELKKAHNFIDSLGEYMGLLGL
jgi:hypothetical protein